MEIRMVLFGLCMMEILEPICAKTMIAILISSRVEIVENKIVMITIPQSTPEPPKPVTARMITVTVLQTKA